MLPFRFLIEILLVLAAALAGQEEEPPEQNAGGKGVATDYGPFLSSSVSRVKYKKDGDLLAAKGITIKLGKDAAVCFDTDLLRMAGGWTGGFLDLTNTHLTSYKGSVCPTVRGTLRFSTPRVPGWGVDGDFKDPRPQPYGPLPPDQARYTGLYLHGDKVVLSYTVAGHPILECPGFERGAFTRTFRLGPTAVPLALLLSDKETAQTTVVVGLPGAKEVVEKGPHVFLKIPALSGSVLFTVVMGPGAEDILKLRSTYPDPAALLKGGPARWSEPQVAKGMLGLGEGAYVVDTLAIPEKNPWAAWIRPGALDFFSDGRCAISTWNGDVWIVSGIDDTLEKLSWRRFAAGLYEPLGLRIVDDAVYVLGRDQITRLHDLDGDGEADFYENFHNGLVTMANYHAFAFELHTDPLGNFYYAADGHRVDPSVPLHGGIVKVAKDGRSHEVFATGLRAPNGMSVGPNGEVTCSDNQGEWVPSSRINWVRKGGFYGYVPHAGTRDKPKDYDKPLCWLPMAMDNSSGGQVWVTSDRWGPLRGHLLHTSYGTAWLFHVLYERVGDEVQGGVVKFPLSFASGIMRGRFSPKDGQLYVCGLQGWQTTGVRDGCLQRVRYTGKPLRTVREMRVTKTGIDLAFTDPLDRESASSADSWGALWWNYAWTEKYGSPDLSVADPKKHVRDSVEIKSVRLSGDAKTVSLEIPAIRPVMQMLIKARLKAADGAPVPVELYLTINRVP